MRKILLAMLLIPQASWAGLFHIGVFGATGAGGSYYHTLNGVEITATQIAQPDGIIAPLSPFAKNLNAIYVVGQAWRRGAPETYLYYDVVDGSGLPGTFLLWKWNCAPPWDWCPVDASLGGGTTTQNGPVFNRSLDPDATYNIAKYVVDHWDVGGHKTKAIHYKIKVVEQGSIANALFTGTSGIQINTAAPSGGGQIFTRTTGSFGADGWQVGWRVYSQHMEGTGNNREIGVITNVNGASITIGDQVGVPPGSASTGNGDEVMFAGPGGPWRQSIELWDPTADGGNGAWMEVYADTFTDVKHSCAHPSGPCSGGDWLAFIEVIPECDWCVPNGGCSPACQMPPIREIGFENVSIKHDGGTSYLESPGTTFVDHGEADELTDSWGVEHRQGNYSFTAGNYYEGVPSLMGCKDD